MKKKIMRTAGVIGAALLVAGIWQMDFPSWKSLDMEKLTDLKRTAVIYDAEDQPVAGLHGGENRLTIKEDEIPEHVKNAFVAIEDVRFFQHAGVDVKRIGGALLSNIRSGGYREGASTITQQLIKLTHLTSEKTLSRKAQEAWLAIQLERRASKKEILEMYLNVVYFGRGAYGIEAAAQAYFGKTCSELTLAEGALLAGVIKAPGTYAPHINQDKAIERRETVLLAMVRAGMIDEETAKEAAQEPVRLVDSEEATEGWYADWALEEATEALGCSAEEIIAGGYRIYTSLRTDMQAEAEQLFQDTDRFPDAAADGTCPEAALIALNPENGEILCMIGGRSYDTRRGLNRAMQIKRQPGSAFKPVSVYAAAVDLLGYTPVSMIRDEARDFGGGYTPSNASGKEYGNVTLRQALSRSMNLASVDLITRTGVQAACMYAERTGIELTESDENLSVALGSLTKGVSPAEMSAAYAPLVNGGHRVTAHAVRRIEDAYGRTVYEFEAENEYVMSEKSGRMITSMLEEAVAGGTAGQLANVGFPVAAKTGTVGETSGGNRDAWTIACTPNVVLSVWMGYDRPEEHLLPAGTTGGSYPARLAAAFLKGTVDYCDGGEFLLPEGMTEVLLDARAIAEMSVPVMASENTPEEYILKEILPDENLPVLVSTLWEEPKRVEAVYVSTDASGAPAISFVAPDSCSEYRIIRRQGAIETEAGCVTGSAGEYVTFVDAEAGNVREAEYYIISRHRLFMEIGRVVESEASESVFYSAPGFLERFVGQKGNVTAEEEPLFGDDPGENLKIAG